VNIKRFQSIFLEFCNGFHDGKFQNVHFSVTGRSRVTMLGIAGEGSPLMTRVSSSLLPFTLPGSLLGKLTMARAGG
jgi:hypothetical protein